MNYSNTSTNLEEFYTCSYAQELDYDYELRTGEALIHLDSVMDMESEWGMDMGIHLAT
jgi:hypothetical protein